MQIFRAELMVLEFKREQAKADVEETNKDLNKINQKLKEANDDVPVVSYDEVGWYFLSPNSG